jgi:histidyl-tRNA synthetase
MEIRMSKRGGQSGTKPSTKPPSGTRDYLPRDVLRRRHVVGVVERVYQQYGFVPVETPAFENLTTLLGKYGEEGDQLLYRLLHRGEALTAALAREGVREADLADLGLRYDLTVPLARLVAQYGELPRFFKRYQIQPVWRADRPGRGRYREFFQCDVDITGTESLVAEAEVCAAVAQVLEELGFSSVALRINHRGLLRGLMHAAGIPEAMEQTTLVAVDKLDKIGAEGVARELSERGIGVRAAAALLELVTEGGGEADALLARLEGRLTSEVGAAAIRELRELWELLAVTPAAQHARLSPQLARGLSYYTGPIFELGVEDLAGSLGGGGRYDELVGMFGKRGVPAVGFSLGLERILLVMQERDMYPPLHAGPEVMVCWMGIAPARALAIAHALRGQGLRAEVYPREAKLGKQLQYADDPGVKAPVAAIAGEDELGRGELTLKHLSSGEQQTVAIERAGQAVKAWLERDG